MSRKPDNRRVHVARQNRQKKIRLPDFIEDAREAFVRRAIAALVVAVFIAAVFVLVKAFLYRSDYFKLRVVETRAAFLDQRAAGTINNQVLSLYKGQNIFKIPLKFISQSIKSSYADVKDIAVKIALPDRIVIEAKLRRPIAVVHNIKYYPIDEEGVVLPPLAMKDAAKDLPVINGVDLKYGRKGTSRNLKLAMELIKSIKQSRYMSDYPPVAINAADPRNMSFYLASGLEVKIGSENFAGRLETLSRTLKDPRLIIDRIKYIDVRFEDVVIGPK